MGIWQSALILLGIGIVSERFGAGVGLGQLGVGIRELTGASLGGFGTGLGEFAGGLRLFGESLGDIGRGFGELFKHLPQVPGMPLPGPADPYKGLPPPPTYKNILYGGGLVPPGYPENGLLTVSGGDRTTDLTGGGGSVPTLIFPSYTPPSPTPIAPQDPSTSVYYRNRPVMM